MGACCGKSSNSNENAALISATAGSSAPRASLTGSVEERLAAQKERRRKAEQKRRAERELQRKQTSSQAKRKAVVSDDKDIIDDLFG
eukprot:m.278102 g.278102  ORF g.278102 m.278102 type:complete len:87 (-) comp19378_c1_seq3:2444-2704(-)